MSSTCQKQFDSKPAVTTDQRQLVARLRESQLFRDYQNAFQNATGMPLGLRSLKSYDVALSKSDGANPFCVLMAETRTGCAQCLEMQASLEQQANLEPASLHCFAGLCDTAVPIRVGDQLIAFFCKRARCCCTSQIRRSLVGPRASC